MDKQTEIPEFESLEDEREYWEARGPLAEGRQGKIHKPQPAQRRSSTLVVRLTGEELAQLRDMAARHKLGTSALLRRILIQETNIAKEVMQMASEIKLELGKRYLVVDKTGGIKGRIEMKVDEISPSGKWYRLVMPGNVFEWYEEVELAVLEELKSGR